MLAMKFKGFTAQIMEAERLVGDRTFGLPPGNPLPVYYVDEFIYPKDEWMKGPGSFVVPVKPEKGLWFDWRDNSQLNTAVVPTIKGANPITGLKTDGFHLESFVEKCPKHGCAFMADRFCPKCDFKWPDRNYCSMSPLWWDGFRADDGTVRQFFFSEDELRDVASSLIGKKNTVPAYGFAFFTPKEMRPEMTTISRGVKFYSKVVYDTSNFSNDSGWVPSSEPLYGQGSGIDNVKWLNGLLGSPHIYHLNENESTGKVDSKMSYSAASCSVPGGALEEKPPTKPTAHISDKRKQKTIKNMLGTKGGLRKLSKSMENPARCGGLDYPKKKKVEVSIGAGAKIRQALNMDTYSLDSWKEKPDAVMTLYFVFQEEFKEIKARGMRSFEGKEEGMLSNTPVG